MTDAQLVERVLAGDDTAFALVMERYRTRLVRYARQMLGNDADAEEALQDAFLRAYRSLARCRDPDRLGSWLLAITANRCRTASRRRWYRDRLFATNPPDPALTGDHGADQAEELAWREAIRHALARLEPRQREAFLLHHVEGLGYAEMAAATGSGISALKMRVQRARARLRTLLQEAGYD
jgi:RNA polymerase sigma-70 factor (ECF subfamily)